VVIGIVLMWIPVPYFPKRVCVIQPASRTYVSSPIDGFLDQAYVRPGDRVEAHALLARLDEKNLLRELSSARAEYEAAQKRQDRALSTKSGGDLRIAQLEQDQIALKIQMLESNLEKLEARSLAAGIVVQGDWQGSEGASLTTGQTLFEIAPLDVMTIEVHIKPEDLAWCKTGTSVTVHSESSVGRNWSGTIERIDPAAETENDEAYFVAELQVENQDGTLRPGMKGLARLHGDRRSLGWLLFHSPYQWFVHQWVW
jgi:multidrug resistance efflux pump